MYTGPLHHLQNCLARSCCPFNFSSCTYTCTSVPSHTGPSHCKITSFLIHLVVLGSSSVLIQNIRRRRRVTRQAERPGQFLICPGAPVTRGGTLQAPGQSLCLSLKVHLIPLQRSTEIQKCAYVCVGVFHVCMRGLIVGKLWLGPRNSKGSALIKTYAHCLSLSLSHTHNFIHCPPAVVSELPPGPYQGQASTYV